MSLKSLPLPGLPEEPPCVGTSVSSSSSSSSSSLSLRPHVHTHSLQYHRILIVDLYSLHLLSKRATKPTYDSSLIRLAYCIWDLVQFYHLHANEHFAALILCAPSKEHLSLTIPQGNELQRFLDLINRSCLDRQERLGVSFSECPLPPSCSAELPFIKYYLHDVLNLCPSVARHHGISSGILFFLRDNDSPLPDHISAWTGSSFYLNLASDELAGEEDPAIVGTLKFVHSSSTSNPLSIVEEAPMGVSMRSIHISKKDVSSRTVILEEIMYTWMPKPGQYGNDSNITSSVLVDASFSADKAVTQLPERVLELNGSLDVVTALTQVPAPVKYVALLSQPHRRILVLPPSNNSIGITTWPLRSQCDDDQNMRIDGVERPDGLVLRSIDIDGRFASENTINARRGDIIIYVNRESGSPSKLLSNLYRDERLELELICYAPCVV